jgi:putative multiple sugar transport system substrate-binding protein
VRKSLTGLVAVGLVLALAACGSTDDADSKTGVDANQGATIGISMPTKTSTRWIADGNSMVEQFTDMGYKVNLTYADNDVKSQVAQVQSMVDAGDKLLVIAAVDGSSMDAVLAKAAAKKIPVIAYDRLLTGTKNVDYQATFDNVQVGTLQGQLLLDRLGLTTGAKGPFNVEIFAGAGDDANAKSFYTGGMAVLKPYITAGKIRIRSGQTAFELVTTERYDGKIAAARMTKILAGNYKAARVDAVLSPYDGMSIGIIGALTAAGYGTKAKPLPIISGQDAELASIKSIIADQQTGTIYKDTRELAKVAVQMGNAALTGVAPMINDTKTYNNGVKVVPTYLLYPLAVDKTNYKTLLVDGGYYKESQITG